MTFVITATNKFRKVNAMNIANSLGRVVAEGSIEKF